MHEETKPWDNNPDVVGPTDYLFGLIENVPGARARLRRLKWSYFLAPDYAPSTGLDRNAMADDEFRVGASFLTWAFLVPHGEPLSLGQNAVLRAQNLSKEVREELLLIGRVRYVFARVEREVDEHTLEVRDQIKGDTLVVRKPFAEAIEPGMGLSGPLFEYERGVFTFNDQVRLTSEAPDLSEWADEPEESIGRLLAIAQNDFSEDWIGDLELREWRRAYEDFAAALKPWGRLTPAGALQKRVLASDSVDELWMDEELAFWNAGEVDVFQAFVTRLAELSSRR